MQWHTGRTPAARIRGPRGDYFESQYVLGEPGGVIAGSPFAETLVSGAAHGRRAYPGLIEQTPTNAAFTAVLEQHPT